MAQQCWPGVSPAWGLSEQGQDNNPGALGVDLEELEQPGLCWAGAAPAWPQGKQGKVLGNTPSVFAALMEAAVDVLMDSGFIY